jgi:methyl-accepting chemotaxis protein
MGQVQEKTEVAAADIAALAEPAQSIADIVTLVNDIAEQTHLLALNAAMEAARAGEHGRGFSVVSAEIRALADQSKQATLKIRRILGDMLKKTGSAVASMEGATKSVAGAVLVSAQAGDTIRILSDTLVEVSQSAAQIVAGSEHQATAMVQVRQATTQIDEIAQQQLLAAQNLQDAAQNLSSLAVELAALAGAKSDADDITSAPLP